MANILNVQDVETNISDIERCLHYGFHKLVLARSITEAIRQLHLTTFDLLICGVHLQERNVFDLLNFVKDNPDRRSLPFLFFCCNPSRVARHVSANVRTTAMLLGADYYLTQDIFDPQEFRDVVESMLPAEKRIYSLWPRV